MKLRKIFKKEFIKKKLYSLLYGSAYNARSIVDQKSGVWGKIKSMAAINYARFTWKRKDYPRLKALKDIYTPDRRGFIICNGPSLNKMDLSKLKDEITLGTNAIYLNFEKMGFKPTYYVVEDNLVGEDRGPDINQLKGLVKFAALRLACFINRDEDTIYLNHHPKRPGGQKAEGNFSLDASIATFGGSTVTYTCMQLAYHLGIREIYLIGCDHDFCIPERYKDYPEDENYIIESQEDDINHFSSDYFGKGYRWHNPKVHKIEFSYQVAKKFCEENGAKIFNATLGGKLEVFERVDFYDLFKEGFENKIYKRFRTLYENRTGIKPLDYTPPSVHFDGVKYFETSVKHPLKSSYSMEFFLKTETVDGDNVDYTYTKDSPPMPLTFTPLNIYQIRSDRIRFYLGKEFDYVVQLPGHGWYFFKLAANKEKEETSLFVNGLLMEQRKVFTPLKNPIILGKGILNRYWKGRLGGLKICYHNEVSNEEILVEISEEAINASVIG